MKSIDVEFSAVHVADGLDFDYDDIGTRCLTSVADAREFVFQLMSESAPGLLLVPDCHADQRFSASIFVTGTVKIRFYAGLPIFIGDQMVGVLSIMDSLPREQGLTDSEISLMEDFAELIAEMISTRREQCIASNVETSQLMVSTN
jgi:transcriptional regulator with GAF, ATPase, and Fis domain